MLVLSRKKNETIVITVPTPRGPENVIVMVSEIRGQVVRLGIEAPPDVPILRSELVGRSPEPEDRRDKPPAGGEAA